MTKAQLQAQVDELSRDLMQASGTIGTLAGVADGLRKEKDELLTEVLYLRDENRKLTAVIDKLRTY